MFKPAQSPMARFARSALPALFLGGLLSLAPWARPAWPSGGPAPAGDHDKGGGSGSGKTQLQDPKAVNMPVLIAPVVQARRLVGYLYVTAQLTMSDERSADHVREVLPLVQDRLLRALNNAPVPADLADKAAGQAQISEVIKAALGQLPDTSGLQAVTLQGVQSVPF